MLTKILLAFFYSAVFCMIGLGTLYGLTLFSEWVIGPDIHGVGSAIAFMGTLVIISPFLGYGVFKTAGNLVKALKKE